MGPDVVDDIRTVSTYVLDMDGSSWSLWNSGPA
ncbi:hypothetical protein EC912_10374 [Luteibacter rhizovicinus]|uniref:Uncharacterized protein n=1 Tax=Luteibacter rhizovicinus TaxID=242606 RepID=A0A4R3YQ99_9GAMM|nr:hypothetical protein EC912_10374 [Luteibacter rhizovicinus]